MTEPTLEVPRILSYHPTPDTHQDAILTGNLGGGTYPNVELRIWNQTTNLLLLLPAVPHRTNVLPNVGFWDWLLPEEIGEMPMLAVGQSVAYFEVTAGGSIYHEAIATARLDTRTLPALELVYWSQATGTEVRIASAEHRDVVGASVSHWRGLNE